LIVVNAATLRTSGKRICQSLKENAASLPVLLIIDEERKVENGYGETILSLPFTVQKLVNRIRNLLPGDGKNSVHTGPIRLDVEKHMVRCQGKQAHLTPRLAQLLRALMENPGVVIERKALFSQVWETTYTEDTRTLDVHISWLRQAIEADPDSPKFIITVRGVGYRLDL
jgi:DNA-binding response OmpR family regulator